VQQARGSIAHRVLAAGDVVMEWEIMVIMLVKGLQAQETGRRCSGGGRAFALPVEGGSVICF